MKLIKSEKKQGNYCTQQHSYTMSAISSNKTLWRCAKRTCKATAYTLKPFTENLHSFVTQYNTTTQKIQGICTKKLKYMK